MNGEDDEVVLPRAEENLIERIFGRRETVRLAELARTLGFHRESLRRAANQGRLPAVKAGGRWLVTRDGLRTYLRADPAPRPRTAWEPGHVAGDRARMRPDIRDEFPELPTEALDFGGEGIPF